MPAEVSSCLSLSPSSPSLLSSLFSLLSAHCPFLLVSLSLSLPPSLTHSLTHSLTLARSLALCLSMFVCGCECRSSVCLCMSLSLPPLPPHPILFLSPSAPLSLFSLSKETRASRESFRCEGLTQQPLLSATVTISYYYQPLENPLYVRASRSNCYYQQRLLSFTISLSRILYM